MQHSGETPNLDGKHWMNDAIQNRGGCPYSGLFPVRVKLLQDNVTDTRAKAARGRKVIWHALG